MASPSPSWRPPSAPSSASGSPAPKPPSRPPSSRTHRPARRHNPPPARTAGRTGCRQGTDMSVIECVPNISEGRDNAKIAAVVDTIRGVPGVTLVSCESDADHNRSVITFAGSADGVVEAAFRIYAAAAKLIDLNHHKGEHP